MNGMDGNLPAPRRRQAPLVLIIEDEEPLARTVSFLVQETGCISLIAPHGQQGLALARTQRPALVIADLMLPHLDGAAVIAALRADAADGGPPAPPIILMTSANLPQARAAGADAVLRKPFLLADLEALLERFLGPDPAAIDVHPEARSNPAGSDQGEPEG
jgi:CheY-like chemotaxis protein